MTKTMLYLHALSPIHAGVGQAAAVIDLPIAREKTTGWPVLPASSFKGVLRQGKVDEAANSRFGSMEAAGEWTFADMHLLFFPARSLYGTFAYVTCPLALLRYERDAAALGLPSLGGLPTAPETRAVLRTEDCALRRTNTESVVFDDLSYGATRSTAGQSCSDTRIDAV